MSQKKYNWPLDAGHSAISERQYELWVGEKTTCQ